LNKICEGTDKCSNNSNKKKATLDESEKQLISKEVIEKFPKPKKWYKKILSGGGGNEDDKFENMKDPMDGMEKIKSIERYKDMSKLIEEKFGKKSYNPVKKSASFMFSTKRVDLEETPTQVQNNPALLKCQSLDTQLSVIEENQTTRPSNWKSTTKSSNASERSFDFRMCILDNENSLDKKQSLSSSVNFDEIKTVNEENSKRKSKPDLIPTLTKDNDSSFITDRLCSEFHVKTKVQKRSVSKHSMLASNLEKTRNSMRNKDANLSIFDSKIIDVDGDNPHVKSVVVQIHENSLNKSKMLEEIEDIPYSHVADEVNNKNNIEKSQENIYAEICEEEEESDEIEEIKRFCKCESNSICKCRNRIRHSEYCYVKLGSNGDSVTSITSDSDEAIYNTLR